LAKLEKIKEAKRKMELLEDKNAVEEIIKNLKRKTTNVMTEESQIVEQKSESGLSSKILLVDEDKLADLNVFKDPISSIII
jgi:hypothetical protein